MSVTGKKETFDISLNQLNILRQEESAKGTAINSIASTVRFYGAADPVLLCETVKKVIRSDASLRTAITKIDGRVMQYHAGFAVPEIPVYDFSTSDEDFYLKWAESRAKEPIFALDAPLFRFFVCILGEKTLCLFVCTHHIISDGWSHLSLCNRIAAAYENALTGGEAEIPVTYDYADYVEDEKKYLASEKYAQDLAYWKDVLSVSGDAVALKPVRGANVSNVGARTTLAFPVTLNNAIYAYCMEQGISPFGVYYAALSACLRRGGCADRISIGVPVFNRNTFRFKNTTGMFVSTLPFLCEADDTLSLNAFCELFLKNWTETLRHQRFPYDEMVHLADEEERMFHIMLSYQSSKIADLPDTTCKISGQWHYCGFQNEQLCIQMTDFDGKNEYSVNYDWLVQLFTEKEIRELHSHVCRILFAALESPDRPLGDIVLADSAERERVVYTHNAAAGEAFPFEAPYALFRKQVEKRPNKAAILGSNRRVTYAELAEMAKKVAAASGAGKLCAVLLPKSEWTFAVMMGVLQAGSAFCSLSTEQPEERIRFILKESGADILFTDDAHAAVFAADVPESLDVRTLRDSTESAAAVTEDTLAYAVYTSGTTGTPKGVEITCGSFSNLCQVMSGVYGDGGVLSLCNTGFDAFILESAAAMCNGQTVVIADGDEKDNPAALAELIEKYGVRFMALTPSRMQAFLHSEAFCRAAGLLKTVICGGEAFPSELLRSLKKVTSAAIYNQYGPSEATVAVSMARLDAADRITAGKPLPGCRLYVLDNCMHPLPENFVGELYIGGACVGKGYRNAPELTEKSFLRSPFIAGERLYKTGDAAMWTPDGEIDILGRKDAQVKLRGLRVEPQEVSSCIARFPGVKAAAVRVADWNGQTVLLGYYVADTELSETDILAFSADYLPHYMVPARVLRIDSVPLTPNGKIDERRLPIPAETEATVLPKTPGQKKLLEIFRRTLNNDKVHAGSDYFLSGGNSLTAMDTLAGIEDAFGLRVPASVLYACRTVVQLDVYLNEHGGAEAPQELPKAPAADSYPASGTQKSLYFASRMDSSGKAYLMPCAFVLPGTVGEEALQRAFDRLAADDPLFRTSFRLENGEIRAFTADTVDLPVENYGALTFAAAADRILSPFDLAKAPLFRAATAQVEGKRMLFLCAHHIICDGLSVPVLLERLDAFYRGTEPAEHLTFFDGAWMSANAEKETMPAQTAYWKEKLNGCPAYTDIAPDFPRPAVFDGKGGVEFVHFGAEVRAAVSHLCKTYGITEYMLFAGAFGILFSRLCGEKTVVLGTPVSGRRTPGFDRIVGPLMRTVPLRLDAEGTLADYFSAVRTSVTEMIDNADCSVTDIAEALELSPRRDRNALYQILFQMRPVNTEEFLLDGKAMAYSPVATGTAKLDLYAEAFPEGDGYGLQMDYAASVYLPETVRGWGNSLERILLTLAAEATDKPLDHLNLSDRTATAEALSFPYRSLQEEIHAATRANPDKTALIWHGTEYSFAALETLACRFVRQLRGAGVGKGDRVGIVMERSPHLFAGLLAILRCGAAYVPFLRSYPADRIQYMMRTAQVRCILCDAASVGSTVEWEGPVLVADETAEPDTVLTESSQQDPIYILFTSGSTGRPKGVQLPQRALSNLLAEERKLMQGLGGPVLCSTTCTFDIFSTESILALAQGFTVILADDTEMLHPWMLAELHRKYQPEITQYTPSRLEMCLKNSEFAAAQTSVRFTILVGENVPSSLVREYHRHTEGARLVNMYGPTEAAVYVTAGDLVPGENVTVGMPLGNCRLYILDENRNMVLPGQKGELYIAGICLADGYVSQPELTAGLFVDNPFVIGEKMYRSGDIFRLRSDGRYECFGRRDGQMKINGIRVELDEINQVFLRSGAQQAVTVISKNPDGSSRLETAVSPETADTVALRKSAAELLPAFMLPSKIAVFPEIPFNTSGKADLPQIRRMLEGAKEQGTPVKAIRLPTETEKSLLKIWEKVLGASGLSPDDSFFRQGGTSLSALNVISDYYNVGITMKLEDFYAHPTVREQAMFLNGVSGAPAEAAEKPKRIVGLREPEIREQKDILLTGATGFLGAHLLRELLEKQNGQIVCLLRDGSRERLYHFLRFYFGEAFPDTPRIEAVQGDILKENLGLSAAEQKNLADRVTLVVHAAADVRHYASDGLLYRVNCEGTGNVAEFALQNGMELAHISTASVSGECTETQPDRLRVFSEAEFDIGQNRENRYICSKMMAEQKVLSAAERGLSARIFRVGRLIGRYEDGQFQYAPEKNAFYRVVQGGYAVGALPEKLGNLPVELLPVDICAKEIVALLQSTSPVYHLVQPHPSPLREIAAHLAHPLPLVPDAVFSDLLKKACTEDRETVGSLIDFLQQAQMPHNILLSSEKTGMLLHFAGVDRPEDVGHGLDIF